MKKSIPLIFCFIFFIGAVDFSVAQSMAVTNTHYALEEVRDYLADGQIERAAAKLELARENIDKAVLNEKTGKKAKTWRYRGETYRQFLSIPDSLLSLKHLEAARIAIESYNKTIVLDQSKTGEYKVLAEKGKDLIYPLLFNQGITSINEKNYTKALESFDLVLMINPLDTNATLNAGLAAERIPDAERAAEYYGKMIYQQGALDYYPFIRMAEYYTDEEEYDKALSVVHKGIGISEKMYSSSKANLSGLSDPSEIKKYQEVVGKYQKQVRDLQTTEFNIYLKSGRLPEAINNLKEAIKTDPNNDGNYSRLGQLLDQSGESDEALKNYEKAVELNSDNIDANYNLGAFYFNRGAETLKITRDMDLKTYKSKGIEMEKGAIEDLKKAKPYFEKVNEIQPNEAAVLNSLETINSILKTNGN